MGRTPAGLAIHHSDGRWLFPRHLQLLNHILIRVMAGELRRVVLNMPPRHGKSEFFSKYLPVCYLGNNPNHSVILSSYEAEFAAQWGGKAKQVMLDVGQACYGLTLGKTSDHRWTLAGHEGSMQTAGAGGAITGKGAHLFLIDDPIKNDQDAMSVVHREHQWNWLISTALTRLEPTGALAVLMCMTGDTPVLMADGTERLLRDLRVGDRVATYEHGKLGVSSVLNRRSNGPDSVYKLTTTSGKIVRANARHPFLVEEEGQLKWIRLKNLSTAHRIVIFQGRETSGKASPASWMSARNRSPRGGTAPRTTVRRCGLTDIVHPRLIQRHTDAHGLSIAMASLPTSMRPGSQRKAESARSASSLPATMCEPIGAASCASTIATTPTPLGGCCATTVTLPWDTPSQKPPHSPWRTTSDFTTDAIDSIESAGIEEVFDVQIEGTENFIANGLVSHNTRWHEDDMTGRILNLAKETGEVWTHVSLPALCEDETGATEQYLGRKNGESLWPERFSVEQLGVIKRRSYFWWNGLYQQRPAPIEGHLVKKVWFRYFSMQVIHGQPFVILHTPEGDVTVALSACRIFFTVDLAASLKTSADFTVVSVWALIPEKGILLWLDAVDERMEGPDQEALIAKLHTTYNPSLIGIEATSYQLTLIQALLRKGLPIHKLQADKDKVSRFIPSATMYQNGLIYHPKHAPWLERAEPQLLSFPNAAHDDFVDTVAYASRMIYFLTGIGEMPLEGY